MIRYYTGLDPDKLNDEEWARVFKEIEFARDQEHKKSLESMNKLLG